MVTNEQLQTLTSMSAVSSGCKACLTLTGNTAKSQIDTQCNANIKSHQILLSLGDLAGDCLQLEQDMGDSNDLLSAPAASEAETPLPWWPRLTFLSVGAKPPGRGDA
jgi:hypothetical protein